jgi:DNA invertase Pin-like site-specific DNA recombinase
MRIAILARVSTVTQDNENQLAQLRDFATKQNWEIVCEYTDTVSGSKSDREGLNRMFEDASKRKFDLLLFWALDRLSREGVLETLQYLRRLESYGVAYKSFTEQFFDSCGVFKDAILAIMATLAKQERIKRSERTKAGLARVKASGVKLGRRPVSTDPSTARRLRAEGHSFRHIASQLGVSTGTVHKLCRVRAQ